jgi:hypothetical protein
MEARLSFLMPTDDRGRVITGCPDGLVRLFDAETLQYITTVPR